MCVRKYVYVCVVMCECKTTMMRESHFVDINKINKKPNEYCVAFLFKSALQLFCFVGYLRRVMIFYCVSWFFDMFFQLTLAKPKTELKLVH